MPHDCRKDSAARQKEQSSPLTRTPLDPNRQKKPQVPAPKKRPRPPPSTPFLTFDPQKRGIPNGKQDPSASLHTPSRPAALQPSTNPHEQQTAPFVDRNAYAPAHDEFDTQEWPHILTDHPTEHYPDASYADINDTSPVPPDPYDSPASCTSSSSPAPSDHSPRTAGSGVDYSSPAQPPVMCLYDQECATVQATHRFPMNPYSDHPMQGYPVYVEPSCGRPGLHGGSYSGNNGYQYPNSRGF